MLLFLSAGGVAVHSGADGAREHSPECDPQHQGKRRGCVMNAQEKSHAAVLASARGTCCTAWEQRRRGLRGPPPQTQPPQTALTATLPGEGGTGGWSTARPVGLPCRLRFPAANTAVVLLHGLQRILDTSVSGK